MSRHHGQIFCAELTMLCLVVACAQPSKELDDRIANQWRSNDSDRIVFVDWVNKEQPFKGLSQAEVREHLGAPTSVHDNQEYPYNGLSEPLTDVLLAAMDDDQMWPVDWVYQTLRKGSKESLEWSGEGSGYLLDLIIQFNVDGQVYGCGTNQYTTGGDYYDVLNASK